MMTRAQVAAVKSAAGSLEAAHAIVMGAIDVLESNGVQVAMQDGILPSGVDAITQLRRELAELLERDVVQRAGAVPD